MRIHKEGITTLLVLLTVTSGLSYSSWVFSAHRSISLTITALLFLFFLFFLRFFRSPKREAYTDENAIIAPADGLVVEVTKVFEPNVLKSDVLKVSIFMSGNDVHINWAPLSGEIVYHSYSPGKHLLAKNPKSSSLNEQASILISQSESRTVLLKQIAGVMARRVVTKTKPGENINQGEEFGFIKLGSRVEVLLPLSCQVNVKPGQRVVGRQTILAKW